MAVVKPDPNAFDANDKISAAQPELKTLVTSFNTIADDYNAGLLGGLDSAGQINLTDTLRIDAVTGDYEAAADISMGNNDILMDGNGRINDGNILQKALINPGSYECNAPLDLMGEVLTSTFTNIQMAKDAEFGSGKGPLTTTGNLRVKGAASTILEAPVVTVGGVLSNTQFVVSSNANPSSNIASPQTGAIVFNTTTSKFQGYNGTAWVDLS